MNPKMVFFAVVLAFLCSCGSANGSGNKVSEDVSEVVSADEKSVPARGTAEGDLFTDFEVDGVKFSDFVGRGKYVLVDFWASWCGPCRGEIPNIAKVYKKYAGDKFDVLSVAVWDMPEDSKAAASSLGIVWNQMLNTGQVATSIYGINGIPHIMLIAPDGTILKRGLRGAAIEKTVSGYLSKSKQ